MKMIFPMTAALLLGAAPSFAFSPSCGVVGDPSYEQQVAEEVFHRVGNQDGEKAKGIAMEILWRDRFNCASGNMDEGRYASLSAKPNDSMTDVYVYDRNQKPHPYKFQMKDYASTGGILSLCNGLEEGLDESGMTMPGDYMFAKVVVTVEGYSLYQELLASPRDNACKRVSSKSPKKELHNSGIRTEDTRRIVEQRMNGTLMVRLDSKNNLVDNYGNNHGRYPHGIPADRLHGLRPAVEAMTQRGRSYTERDLFHRTRAEAIRLDNLKNPDYKPSAHKPNGYGEFVHKYGIERIAGVNDNIENSMAVTIDALRKSEIAGLTLKRVMIPPHRVPEGVNAFIDKAMPALKSLPWFRTIRVVGIAAGTGYLVYEIAMNDDPDADARKRVEEALKLLSKEGVVALTSTVGFIAGGAAGGAAGSLACGMAAPVCVAVTTTIGALAGGVVAAVAVDYVIE